MSDSYNTPWRKTATAIYGPPKDGKIFGTIELDVTDAEQVFKQLFTCHVKCGTKVEYHYYKDGDRVTTTIDPVENEGMLLEILKRVVDH